jgi:hypothetical protein
MSIEVGVRVRAGSIAAHVRVEDWVGRVTYVLSLALAAVALAATAATLLFPDALRGPAVSIGQLQGTALVLMVVTLPVLDVSMALVARGVVVALIFWLGALGSIVYQAVLFLVAAQFNQLFFLYVAVLSLSIWGLLALAWRVPIESVGRRVGVHAPVRLIAAYLLVNTALYLALWLQALIPAVIDGGAPAFLEGTGMTTGPVQILDLAFTLPLMTLAAILLIRRSPAGQVLTGAMLVMLAIETLSIGVDQWLGHTADPASPAASIALTPIFGVLTIVGVAVLALFLRPAPGGSRTDRRP